VSVFYEFDEVDAFTTGAVGRPGERTFFLQIRAGRQRVSVKCEKQQVAAIAAYLRRVLVDLPPPEDRPMPGALELATPIDPVFVLGPIGLGYDRTGDRLVVQLEELVIGPDDLDDLDDDTELGDEDLLAALGIELPDDAEGLEDLDAPDDDEDEAGGGTIRIYVSRSQAAAFCDHADAVIAAGRPTCQWCARPIDPDGHPCPRMN
jgi:uncharacterized repeat protein (TIGR03847 family)